MTKKDKYVSYATAGLFICCYLCALVFHDIPSYEQDTLEGVAALLHWCVVLYLPLFPIIAGIFVIAITEKVKSIAVTATNFLLTLVFTIFACSSGILSTSWIFLSIASFIVALAAHYDKRNSVKICDKKTPA